MTDADLATESLLKRRLRGAMPEAGWLSEETVDDFERLSRRSLIIVDPIDGTRAFVIGDPRWAVSVALVVDERPVAGVVYAPALARSMRPRVAEAQRSMARLSSPTLAGRRARPLARSS